MVGRTAHRAFLTKSCLIEKNIVEPISFFLDFEFYVLWVKFY